MILFTRFTTSALLQLATKAHLHQMVQAIAQRSKLDAVYHLIDKGKLQQEFGLSTIDASLLHIEKGGIV